jgi:hypothetical protein
MSTIPSNSFVEAARRHRSKPYGIVWLRPGEKYPKVLGWTTRSMEPEEYNPGSNIGLMTGWISGNLVCVDLDHPSVLERADEFLPPTGMIDGRPGKPRSHRWYIVTDIPEELTSQAEQAAPAAIAAGKHPGPKTLHFANSVTKKNLIDFLGTGAQATVPPSVVSEEERVWESDGEPATVPAKDLFDAVCRLAEACGWTPPDERLRRAAEKLEKVAAATAGKGGRQRTYHAARTLVNDCDLSVAEAWPLFKAYNERCVPPWSEKELYQTLERAADAEEDPRFPRGRGLRPRIQHSVEIARTLDQAVDALRREADLYQRGGQLVHVVNTGGGTSGGIYRPPGTPRIVPVPWELLWEMLATNAEFVKYDVEKDETKVVPPQRWVPEGILARGQWDGIRELRAVVEVPVLLPDGRVLEMQGYDQQSGLLYVSDGCKVAVPSEPTKDDAVRAIATLLGVVKDFPFVTESHRSAWLAYLLTPFARYAFEGPVPLTLISANVAGAGKGLLCGVISTVYSGRPPAIGVATPDDAEMRKVVTSIALAGDTMVVLDNVSGVFGCPTLDAALTATVWTDRILGSNVRGTWPLDVVWAATANNPELEGDIHRRLLHVLLDSKHEYPEDRKDFEHEDLLSHVRGRRAELISAALTVLRAYCVAGRPTQGLVPWGSFEGWSKLVRNAVVWAGQSDPNDARLQLRSRGDQRRDALESVLTGLEKLDPENYGSTTALIVSWLDRLEGLKCDEARDLREALERLGARVDSVGSVGKKLGTLVGRVCKGRRLVMEVKRSNKKLWSLEYLK